MSKRKKREKEHKIEEHVVNDYPRLCLFDFPDKVLHDLTAKGLNCTEGTLGKLVEVPNIRSGDEHFLHLNSSNPSNLHEYQILAIDMHNNTQVPYESSSLNRENVRGDKLHALLSKYPETIFDPRSFSMKILGEEIDKMLKNNSIIIIFSDTKIITEYKIVEIKSFQAEVTSTVQYGNYSFYSQVPPVHNKQGKVIETTEQSGRFKELLNKYLPNSYYQTTFSHPAHWNNGKSVKDNNFIPLLVNGENEIVSYIHSISKSAILVLPQIQNKGELLVELLTSDLPEIFPEIFPNNKKYSWLEEAEYFLPNHSELLSKKDSIDKEYAIKLNEITEDISSNHDSYQFLHDLLIQTDSGLVKSVEKLLNYLEFENVINVDETDPELREEDLRADIDDKLLVIEVKGIGGTSTDSDCAQISKIRYRRCEERVNFDVFGLYIVNHRRHLPPEKRENPPFNEQQIKDANNDKRGLLTTYQLYKLYFMIENDIITKEDASKAMIQYGYVEFKPSNTISLGTVTEIFKNHTVAIVNLKDQKINVGDKIIVKKDTNYTLGSIISIMKDDKEISATDNGEIGIMLDIQIPNKSELLLKVKD
jgi:hypothetical protein